MLQFDRLTNIFTNTTHPPTTTMQFAKVCFMLLLLQKMKFATILTKISQWHSDVRLNDNTSDYDYGAAIIYFILYSQEND